MKRAHQRFKAVLLLCMFLLLPSPGVIAEGTEHARIILNDTAYISPEIAASVVNEPGKPVEALILLKEQADTHGTAKMARNLMERTLRIPADRQQIKSFCRKVVVRSLQDVAESTQGPLLGHLNLEKLLGRVINLKSFYIVNMIYIEAHPAVIVALSKNPAVKSILPNTSFELQESEIAGKAIPAEEIAPSAQTVEWNIRRIRADEVWEQFEVTGEGVVVGVIDSGVYWQHPALKTKYRGYNPDNPSKPDNEYNWYDAVYGTSAPNDCLNSSHGTHVTGIIVASTATNVYGAAPGARWIAANAFKTDGSSSPLYCIDAAQYMLAPRSEGGLPDPSMAPDILNCSWGMVPDGEQTLDEWFRPMVLNLRSAGILPVFAAGNAKNPPARASSIHSPAMYPESLSVAAVNNQNVRASFSNRGPAIHYPGVIKPDISAPGVGIYSTFKNGNYGSKDGTSMATPHIAGTAALILSYRPTLSVDELEDMIRETAIPLTGGADTDSPNHGYGYGLVDAYAAIKALGWIKDPNLEAAIREELGIPESKDITIEDLEELSMLIATGKGIKNLDGLQYAINLEQIDLSGNEITDIAPLVSNSNSGGLGHGDEVDLRNNYLDLSEGSRAREDIDALEANGVDVMYDPQKQPILGKMSPPEWDGRKIKWNKINFADHYRLKLYKDNIEVFSKILNNESPAEYDMAGKIDDSGHGHYTATIQAMGDGNPWITGEPSDHSAKLKIIAVPDANLENLLKIITGIDKGGISDTDMAGLTQINYTDKNKKISDLTGIEYAVNLVYIKLTDQNIGNISPLASLTNLLYLNLDNNNISDIFPLVINSDAGGFKTGGDKPKISLKNNCLSLDSSGQTMNYINLLVERGIEVDYIPQRKIPVNSVTLDRETLELMQGDTEVLLATIHPQNASNKEVTWSTKNSAVARVDQFGKVEAIGSGTTKITVKSEDGGHEAICTVNVIPVANNGDPLKVTFHDPADNERDVPINKIVTVVFNKDIKQGGKYDRIMLKEINQPDQEIGLTKEIEGRKIFLTPVEKLKYGNTIYELSFPVGAVEDSTGKKNPAFEISFETPRWPIRVESVSLNASHLKLFCGGATATLVPIVKPDHASDWECRWESSNPETATVTGDRARNGIVTPLGTGSTYITAIISDQGDEHRAKCIVDAIKFGDVNGDGKVEVGDAIILLRHIVGLNPLVDLYEHAGRVNGEPEITVSDAISVLRYIVQLISQFPAEVEMCN